MERQARDRERERVRVSEKAGLFIQPPGGPYVCAKHSPVQLMIMMMMIAIVIA